jgi:hypothetical protein
MIRHPVKALLFLIAVVFALAAVRSVFRAKPVLTPAASLVTRGRITSSQASQETNLEGTAAGSSVAPLE